jgi:hypothetical protein
MFQLISPLVAAVSLVLLGTPQQAATASHARASETALDRYVAAPDPNFNWKVLRRLPADGASVTLIEMTSQKWLTEREVEKPPGRTGYDRRPRGSRATSPG